MVHYADRHLNTVGIQKLDMSGFRMVTHVRILNGVQILNGRPLPFENRVKMSSFRMVID